MKFHDNPNYQFNFSLQPFVIEDDCSQGSLLNFILKYYKMSKSGLAAHLGKPEEELENMLNDNTPPSAQIKEKIIELLK